ncbi:hypothetical protein D3C71_2046840 [compost metagenome]
MGYLDEVRIQVHRTAFRDASANGNYRRIRSHLPDLVLDRQHIILPKGRAMLQYFRSKPFEAVDDVETDPGLSLYPDEIMEDALFGQLRLDE